MKPNRHTEEQSITTLKAYERGVSVAELGQIMRALIVGYQLGPGWSQG